MKQYWPKTPLSQRQDEIYTLQKLQDRYYKYRQKYEKADTLYGKRLFGQYMAEAEKELNKYEHTMHSLYDGFGENDKEDYPKADYFSGFQVNPFER